jgi:sugar phosphate isomerase/epimerase
MVSLTQNTTSGIIGYTGFVGSNLCNENHFTYTYNTKNISEITGVHFDILYIAACPAEKWRANKFPEKDAIAIKSLTDSIKSCTADKVILISTIDVYNLGDGDHTKNEDTDVGIGIENHHTYGRNRLLFEKSMLEYFGAEQLYIIRLPALFSHGLKKNYLYDLLHDNDVHKIKRNTKFQWYDLRDLTRHIEIAVSKNIHLINLFPAPVCTQDVIKTCAKTGAISHKVENKVPIVFSDAPLVVDYCVRTKYAASFDIGGTQSEYFLYDEKTVLKKMESYCREFLISQRLTISNIAWDWEIDGKEHKEVMNLLHLANIKHVEVAPTKIWGTQPPSWDKVKSALENGELKAYAQVMKEKGIVIPSYQALLYACKNCELFKSAESLKNLIQHLKWVIDMAIMLSGYEEGQNMRRPALVFGAPKSRNVYGKSKEECNKIFDKTFKGLGEYAYTKGAVIVLESNPKEYKCEYLYNVNDCADRVRAINSPGFKLHVDLACMTLDGLDGEAIEHAIKQNADIIYHCHISEPFLAGFDDVKCDHSLYSNALKDNLLNSSLQPKFSIEMRGGNNNPSRIKTCLQFVLKTYFGLHF